MFADPATHQRVANALAERDRPVTLTLQIVLLVAELEGGGTPADLPANARAALADVQGLLPFRSYRLVDMAWVRARDNAQASLAGPDGAPCYADLVFQTSGEDIDVRAFGLECDLLTPVAAAVREGAGIQRQRVLTTRFAMKVGETVVVGTSRLDGDDEALVVREAHSRRPPSFQAVEVPQRLFEQAARPDRRPEVPAGAGRSECSSLTPPN